MKAKERIIAVVLALIVALCSFTTVAASETKPNEIPGNSVITSTADEATKDEYLFLQKFIDIELYGYVDELIEYDEPYYHYDDNGNVDWAIVYAITLSPPILDTAYIVVEDILIRNIPIGTFGVDYGIYSVEDDRFFPIDSVLDNPKYKDIPEALRTIEAGEIIGDMDYDRKLTVKDATFIQSAIANIVEFPLEDKVCYLVDYDPSFDKIMTEELTYISDYNRDGKRDIKDATAIQRRVAGLITAFAD